MIQPIGVLGSAADVEVAQGIAAECVAHAQAQADESGLPPFAPKIIELAWRRLRAAHWDGKLRAQLCYDRYAGWSTVLVVRSSSRGTLWFFRDQTQMPRLHTARRTKKGPYLYPLDQDSWAIALLCWHDVGTARLKLLQLESEYEARISGLVGSPPELAERQGKEQRSRTLREVRLKLFLQRAESKLRSMGVELEAQPEPPAGPQPFESDREAWIEGRRLAGQLSRLRGRLVMFPDDAEADRQLNAFCQRLKVSSNGVSLARIRAERKLNDEQTAFVLLLALRHYGLPVQIADIYTMTCGIDPISLTALRSSIRRKRSLRELIEFDGGDMQPSQVLIDEVSGRIELKTMLQLAEDVLLLGLTERKDIPDNKDLQDGGEEGRHAKQ